MKNVYLCLLFLSLMAACLSAPSSAYAENEEDKAAEQDDGSGSDTGFPIPRFVTLRFEEVNARTGPGTRYPIRWVYKRPLLPVEVIEEFGHWRKIRDAQGDEGWVHKSQLSGTRTALVLESGALQRYPEEGSPPMIKVESGVSGKLLECNATWCRIQIESYKAWVKKRRLWGVYPEELL